MNTEERDAKANYERYLESEAWAKTRKRLASCRDARKCAMCGSYGRCDLHHLTYARLGHEANGDLTFLCRSCHEIIHKATKIGRTDKPDQTHRRFGDAWYKVANHNKWWSLRETDPESFKLLARDVFLDLLLGGIKDEVIKRHFREVPKAGTRKERKKQRQLEHMYLRMHQRKCICSLMAAFSILKFHVKRVIKPKAIVPRMRIATMGGEIPF